MVRSLNWVVVEQKLPGGQMRPISKHATQEEVEAERDRRNRGRTERPLSAVFSWSPWRSAWEGTRHRRLQLRNRLTAY